MTNPCNNTKYGLDGICDCGHRKGDHAGTQLEDAEAEECECGHCGSCIADGDCQCPFFSEDVDASIEVNEDAE